MMTQRPYIDFKLLLTQAPNGQGCQVALLPTPEVGETVSPVTVPADRGPTAGARALVAGKGITLRNLVAFGKGLANWLLPDEAVDGQASIRALFVDATKRAGNGGGVRLRLIIADHALKQWPWEYVYFDPSGVGGPDSMSGFLALDPRISIVRHEPLPHPHPVTQDSGTNLSDLRMVIAAASPKTRAALNVAQEVSIITGALQDLTVDGTRLTAVPILDATLPEVVQALRGAGSTYLFHFAGHGITEATKRDPFSMGKTREEGFLYFVDDKMTKTESKVWAEGLAKLLQAAGVRLAVFGACYSGYRSERYPWDGVAGALARRGIPASISMQYEVSDTHALAFSRALYAALASGLSLDEAMSAARLAMFNVSSDQLDGPGFLEWGVPVLYSRLRDGRLFPERMQRAGAIAQQLRLAIQQTVDTIASTGRVVGLEARVVNGTFEVIQKAGLVEGEMKGIEATSITGSGRVQQSATTVTGRVTGVSLDSL